MKKLSQNQAFRLISIVVASAVGCILFILLFGVFDYNEFFNMQQDGPTLQGSYKKNLKIELVAKGLSSPTSMAFIDGNNTLILEKNSGLVRLISGGVLQSKPVLKLPIDNKAERGLLGIAVLHTNNINNNTNVFLYFTESNNKSSKNIPNDVQLEKQDLQIRVEWTNPC